PGSANQGFRGLWARDQPTRALWKSPVFSCTNKPLHILPSFCTYSSQLTLLTAPISSIHLSAARTQPLSSCEESTTLESPHPACDAEAVKVSKMENRWDLLVVSGRLENKKALLHILYDLPVFVFTASAVRQAHEVLATRPIRLVFCEENL